MNERFAIWSFSANHHRHERAIGRYCHIPHAAMNREAGVRLPGPSTPDAKLRSVRLVRILRSCDERAAIPREGDGPTRLGQGDGHGWTWRHPSPKGQHG